MLGSEWPQQQLALGHLNVFDSPKVSATLSFGPPRGVPSLICLHGFAGSPHDWGAVLTHMNQTRPQNTALAVPLPGHHPLYPPVADFEAAVSQLLSGWPDDPVDLLGYSLGGRLALAVAHFAPHRVRRLMIVAAHTGRLSATERTARIQQDTKRARELREDPILFFERWDELPMFEGPNSPELSKWKTRRSKLDPGSLADTLELLSLGRMPDLQHVLTEPTHPCIAVVGALDTKARQHYAQLQSSAPELQVLTLSDAAHRVPIDAPKSLADALLDWLEPPPPMNASVCH